MTDVFYTPPPLGWTCFHCSETFTTIGSARDHFGKYSDADPACMIKAGHERGLVMALRRAEQEVEDLRVQLRNEQDDNEMFAIEIFGIKEKFGSIQDCLNKFEELEGRLIESEERANSVYPMDDHGRVVFSKLVFDVHTEDYEKMGWIKSVPHYHVNGMYVWVMIWPCPTCKPPKILSEGKLCRS